MRVYALTPQTPIVSQISHLELEKRKATFDRQIFKKIAKIPVEYHT